ncbi:MAG TPA: hypothetical protein VHA74_01130 [Candidatus Dojkabacteria bacterium]|nr:hypothetical protein [Candidatus Dojkabacteria bacterium]
MKSESFKVLEGKNPVLLSAPHAFNHYRSNINQVYKAGEPVTDDIVRRVAANIDCYGIFTTQEMDYDPNSTSELLNIYQREVEQILKDKKIKYFIDIHGLNDKYDYDMAIYYPFRFSKSQRFADRIKTSLMENMEKHLNIQVLNFPENQDNTLSINVSHKLRVPSIQIEVARYIREDEFLLEKFIEAFEKSLLSLINNDK